CSSETGNLDKVFFKPFEFLVFSIVYRGPKPVVAEPRLHLRCAETLPTNCIGYCTRRNFGQSSCILLNMQGTDLVPSIEKDLIFELRRIRQLPYYRKQNPVGASRDGFPAKLEDF